MKGLDENDAKGVKYAYRVIFLDGNLFSGKTAFLDRLREEGLNAKLIVHELYKPEELQRLRENPERWMFSILLNDMVMACKHLLKELKTPHNSPYVIIEKSIFHFLTLGELEFQAGNMDRMELAMLREECKFLFETIRRYLRGIAVLSVDSSKCRDNRVARKLPQNFDSLIEKYWEAYSKVIPAGVPQLTFALKDDLSNAPRVFKEITSKL